MNIYAVVLNEPSEHAWKRLRAEWPEPLSYVLNNRIAFIALSNGGITTGQIATKLGMEAEQKITGFVMHSAAVNGWNSADLWEWMRAVENA